MSWEGKGRQRAAVIGIMLCAVAGGCASKETPPPAERVDTPTAGTVERPSNLSYGTVTAIVKMHTEPPTPTFASTAFGTTSPAR